MPYLLRSTLILALASAAFAEPASAQEAARPAAEEAVVEVVRRLFDGMRAGDSAMVRSTFAPDARLVSTALREGEPTLRSVPIDGFVAAIGQPRDVVWDERIWDIEVRIDEHLATVWAEYAFYLGSELSHCGVDAFQLFGASDGWKIFQIADTRRGAETCKVPG